MSDIVSDLDGATGETDSHAEARARTEMERARVNNETFSSTAPIEGLMLGGEKDTLVADLDKASRPDSGKLSFSMKLGSKTPADDTAEHMKLASQTGLPVDTVARNKDDIVARLQATDAADYQEKAPSTSKWISDSPNNASIAQDDHGTLAYIENKLKSIGTQFTIGSDESELTSIGVKALTGTITPADRDRQEQLEADQSKRASFGLTPEYAASVAPSLLKPVGAFMAGAGVGSLAGPEGIAAGGTAAVATYFGRQSAGDMYLQLEKMRPGGQPISRPIMQAASVATGVLNSALMLATGGKYEKPLLALQGQGIKELLSSPTIMGAVAPYLKKMALSGATMMSYGYMNSLINTAATTLAPMIQDGSIHKMTAGQILGSIFNEDTLAQAGKESLKSGVTGLGMGAAEGFPDMASHLDRAAEAERTAQAFKDVGMGVKNSKLNERLPESMQEVVSRMADDNGVPYVYQPIRSWNDYWNGKADPREVAKEVTGSYDAYDQANRTGSDMPIETHKWATKLAPTDHGEFFANELRKNPADMNANEYRYFTQEMARQSVEKANKEQGIEPPKNEPIASPEQSAVKGVMNKIADFLGFQPKDVVDQPKKVDSSPDIPEAHQEYVRGVIQEEMLKSINARKSDNPEEGAEKTISRAEEVDQPSIFSAEKSKDLSKILTEKQIDDLSDVHQKNVEALRDRIVENQQKLYGKERDEIATEKENELFQDPRYMAQDMLGRRGVDEDAVAALTGFYNSDKMRSELEDLPDRKEEALRQANDAMKAKYGDLMEPQRMQDEALKQVKNQMGDKLDYMDLKVLASDKFSTFKGTLNKLMRSLPDLDNIKAQAEDAVRNQKVRQIHSSLYERAKDMADREAVAAYTKGDFDGAWEAKLRKLINSKLYQASRDAEADIAKIPKYMSKFGDDDIRARIGKAGEDYLDQIDKIMDRFDFRKSISLKDIDEKSQSLLQFLQSKQKDGSSVGAPNWIMDESQRTHYKNLTYGQLSDLRDQVRQIEYLANKENNFMEAGKAQEFDMTKQRLLDQMRPTGEPPIPREPAETSVGKAESLLKEGDASLTRMEMVFRSADDEKPMGENHRFFVQRAQAMEDEEVRQTRELQENDLPALTSEYTKEALSKWYVDRPFIPEVNMSMSKPMRLAVALNCGNDGNYSRLVGPYRWSRSQVDAILGTLDAKDLEFVNKVWALYDKKWEDAKEFQRKQTGLEPKSVEPTPFDAVAKDGTTVHMTGGYHPIVTDKEQTGPYVGKKELNPDLDTSDLLGGRFIRAMTEQGHFEQRTANKNPLLLSLSPIANHLDGLIHDMTHRDGIVDMWKMANDPDMKKALVQKIGIDKYNQINPWLERIAGNRQGEPLTYIDKLANAGRRGMTVAELGFNFVASGLHTSNFLYAANEIGYKNAAEALRNYEMHREDFHDFINGASPFMANLGTNYERDIHDSMHKMNAIVKTGGWESVPEFWRGQIAPAFYSMFGRMYQEVAEPAWLGAYAKAMNGDVENVEMGDHRDASEYADHVVRTTITSAGVKDLPAIMSKDGLLKTFTMFYTPMSIAYNNIGKVVREFRTTDNLPRFLSSVVGVGIAPGLLQGILRGNAPHDSDWKDWAKFALKSTADYYGGMIPGVRVLTGGDPAARYYETIGKALSAGVEIGAHKILGIGDKDEMKRKDWENVFMSAGYMSQMPTRQLMKTAEYLIDYQRGVFGKESIPMQLVHTIIGEKTPK